jgi:hypothetical protein
MRPHMMHHSRIGDEHTLGQLEDIYRRQRLHEGTIAGQHAVKAERGEPRDAAGTAELMLTFVERGTGFAADLGYGDEDFFSSLEGML